MMDVQIADWKLLRLTVEGIGPFQNGREEFSFIGARTYAHDDPGPSNLYMLLAKNGYGKTTLLECIFGLFGLMSEPAVGRFAVPGNYGSAQLDVRATWTVGGATQTVVLSVWTGTEMPISAWTSDDLDAAQASNIWARLGLESTRHGVLPTEFSDELGKALYQSIQDARGRTPGMLFGEDQDMPSVLFFPADRSIVRPEDTRRVERPTGFSYQPAHRFASDGPDWATTIDNLLVWLEWLDDGRLVDLLEFVNGQLFVGQASKAIRTPRRQELLTYVSTLTGEHPLVDLSHGERALLQFYIRIACSMTRNSVVLIDEVEMHLHSGWLLRFIEGIKDLLRATPSLSVIFTTHSRELIRLFDHHIPEDGLVKGGHIIEHEIN